MARMLASSELPRLARTRQGTQTTAVVVRSGRLSLPPLAICHCDASATSVASVRAPSAQKAAADDRQTAPSFSNHLPKPFFSFARKIRSTPPHALRRISLAQVLAGDTCAPIALEDFEAHLAFVTHALELLQFVVWFHDYRQRFFALPDDARASCPPPCAFAGAGYGKGLGGETEERCEYTPSSPAKRARRAREGVEFARAMTRRQEDAEAKLQEDADRLRRLTVSSYTVSVPPLSPISPWTTRDADADWEEPLLSARAKYPESAVSSPTSSVFPRTSSVFPRTSSLSLTLPSIIPSQQPFRDECAQIVATFLKPGAVKELSLDAIVRDTAVRNLTWGTHPAVFLPVYEEVYEQLETVCLPHFLTVAAMNINRPKQLFWYAVGLSDLLISLLLALTFVLDRATAGQRAWRVFSLPFALFGSMQFYAAARGICTQVIGRDSVQLRTWELQEADSASAAYWARVLADTDVEAGGGGAEAEVRAMQGQGQIDVPAIAPFAQEAGAVESDARARTTSGASTSRPRTSTATAFSGARGRNGYRRPPIFGPERVVKDARIIAVHKQIIHDILWFGAVYTLIFAAIVLSVPGRK